MSTKTECPWDEETCSKAAKHGHLECLKYVHEKEDVVGIVCLYGSCRISCLECLKYAHENGCRWGKYTCMDAAANGQLGCLKYAHEKGCRWCEDTCMKLPNMVTSSV